MSIVYAVVILPMMEYKRSVPGPQPEEGGQSDILAPTPKI